MPELANRGLRKGFFAILEKRLDKADEIDILDAVITNVFKCI